MAAVELNCSVTGRGPGLVLLHPVGLDHSFWGGLVGLASRTHRVLSVDLRGHGESPAAERGLTTQDYAADVVAAMIRYQMDSAIVLGLSFGGMIAQELVLLHPNRVCGLVLCGCPAGFPAELTPLLMERGLLSQREGMGAVVETTLARWFSSAFTTSPGVGSVRNRLLRNDPMNWSAAWHAIANFNVLPRLNQCRAPTLIIAGHADASVPLTLIDQIAQAIDGAKLVVLANAPHMMQIETEAAFTACVTKFITNLSAPI